MSELPFVSCVIAAYNYGRYLPEAIDSALAQDYPADRLEIVAVDDGSTDDTREVLARYAAAHPGRVTVIHQENAGYIAATSRAVEAARGELIALLDADDAWLPHKTRAQVELLLARPEVGLVFGEMTVVDADGVVTDPSFFHYRKAPPVRGWLRGAALSRSLATASSIMLRASLRHLYLPLPPQREMPYQDWWFVAQVAKVAELDYVEEPVALHRRHGANMDPSGTGDAAAWIRDWSLLIRQVRYLMARTDEQEVALDDIRRALRSVAHRAQMMQRRSETHFVTLTEITDADRAAARRELAAEGRDVTRLFAALRAVGHDPSSDEARERLAELVARLDTNASDLIAAHAASARPVVLVAEAAELLAEPGLCDVFAGLTAADPVTVLITVDEDGMDEIVPRLEVLLAERGLDGEDVVDLVALPCPPMIVQQLAPGTMQGIVTALPRRGVFPCFGPGDAGGLRALADGPATAVGVAA